MLESYFLLFSIFIKDSTFDNNVHPDYGMFKINYIKIVYYFLKKPHKQGKSKNKYKLTHLFLIHNRIMKN